MKRIVCASKCVGRSELRVIRLFVKRKRSIDRPQELVVESPHRVWRQLKSSTTRKGCWIWEIRVSKAAKSMGWDGEK